ncbi:MAG: RNB domain-containing ribonuclease [Deltaproteobacteria bacterium]|nr:RNB domain-containing ribonuclease [Deltaproteobacteria bacterium]
MSEGKIIEYIEQGKWLSALCLQDKGPRLHLLTPLNRLVNLPSKRATFMSPSHISMDRPREELLNRLREIDLKRVSLKEEIDVKELWELIKDENESFDYKYLAQLCFGEEVTDDHISALIRALFDDKLYFKMKDGQFIPNPDEKIETILKQQEEAAQKEEKLAAGSAWLNKAIKEGSVTQGACDKVIIDTLAGIAIHGKEANEYQFGRELLERAGITDTAEVRSLLVRLGIWEKDEPIDLIRYNIRQAFSNEQLDQASELNNRAVSNAGREDLSHLNIFTIDGADSLDFDDAISFDLLEDRIQVGIHITDVSSVVDAGSILEDEALLRGSSLYLPRREIPMFPPELSHERLSLKKGAERQALSLLINFDMNGDIFDYRFVPSIIRVKDRMTYDQVNSIYETERETMFHDLFRLAQKRKRHRVEQGALILSLPELNISVDSNSSISIELVSQETPSRSIVAEMMILYNWLAARFCRDNRIPTIYRGQKEPGEKLPLEDTGYVYYVFRQRRKLHPLIIDVEPHPHAGLGLDAYINVTSPIRRYFDLVSQRQMLHFMFKGTPLYNREELEKIRMQVTSSLKDLNTVRRNRYNYWIIRYLEKHTNKTFSAIVLDALKSRYRIILTDFFITVEMKREKDSKLLSGDQIKVKVTKADAWNEILKLEYVKD